MRVEAKNKKMLLQAALGKIESDLAITNAMIVNVFTGEILPGTIYCFDGFISHVAYEEEKVVLAKEIYDAKGQYVLPGFIDSHMHVESTMQTPRHFAEAAIPWGTTTVITDPHEIANVWGMDGVRYMHDSSEGLPMRQLIDIPSCVPAVPSIETCGADFLAEKIGELMGLERVIGLAEVMDFLAVMNGEDRILAILEEAKKRGLYIQGHAPSLTGRELSAYLCGGPISCHETFAGEEARAKLRAGMYVDARESSIAKNVEDIWSGINDLTFYDTLTLCTDDREPDDLLKSGHMNDVVNKAISCGMNPILAIKSATINAAREAKLEHIGAIAPGYTADLVIAKELHKIVPTAVFFGGELVAERGRLLVPIEEKTYAIETTNSMNLPALTVEDFKLKAPIAEGRIKTNVMTYLGPAEVICSAKEEELEVKGGYLTLNEDTDLKYVAVINRYGTKKIAVHVVRGFGMTKGAIASTVSHDCHNLTIVYEKPEEAYLAYKELAACGGGMCAVEDETILHTLELPVGGLMSLKKVEELAKDAYAMKEAERKLGLQNHPNPLLRIVTIALPVIPEVKMSDSGLVDVQTKTLLPLYVE